MTPIGIMLVDDHTVVRAGLRALMDQQTDMKVVAQADNSPDALSAARAAGPDVVVLDLSLPGGGTLELIGKLQGQPNPPRVLVLTMHDEPAYARSALASGATGYIVKTIREQDLLAAVRAVYRGQVFVDLDNEAKTAAVLRPSATGKKDPTGASRLSERETEVLRLLGQGHTNQAIADKLDISPKTVATYRARLAEKLGLKATADFVRFVNEIGMIWD
ncbi:response regulator [Frigoriglobus tundricola]|uniref:Two-component transcriptional response regulator, LuxR family n=1 Tax=Frigoriglobus tundricola TaxID=2774151 RepID=A0A6M5Z188_9BACT|nr:response regulator transcription factor [Frigoriglobus tundricola]QJX00158.1 hypothetical protein FTUN_7782 [Frigoriglobus tundricola]